MESLIDSYSYHDDMNLLSPSQYGFRKAHSTQCTIFDTVPWTQYRQIRTNDYSHVVLLKKAFVTVDHNTLLHRLEYYGFRGVINRWFSSYLQCWTQTGPHVSSRIDFTWGVTQGSVLGPLLFLLWVNNIQIFSGKFNFYFFADDTNI